MSDYALGTTIYLGFTTRAFATGVPATLSGSPVLSVLEENNATPITSGVSISVDRASVTGLNEATIVASSGNGFEAGKEYSLYISTGTVGGTSVVGEVVGHFSIEKVSALRPTTGGRTLDVTAGGEAGIDWANIGSPTTTVNLSGTSTLALEPTTAGRKLDVSTGGEAGLDWANIGSPTTAVNLSATNIDVDQVVASVSGAVASVTGNVGGSVTGSVGSVVGAVGSVTGNVGGNVTGSVGSVVGAVGSVTGNVGGNVTGSVGSVAAGGITASSIATGAIDADALATDAVSEIADGVWDEAIAGHLGAGSTGAALNAAGSAGDPWSTSLPGAYGAGTAGFIVGTNLDGLISDIPTAVENADALLNRDFAAVSDTNARTLLNANRFLRNLWSVSGGTLTVKKENDVDTAWVATISTDAAAIPIVGSDPA